jgi:MFS family permease
MERHTGAGGADDEPDESELERWQRNYGELLQELRVAQMGVQILFAFLLTLSFSNRFDQDDRFAEVTYVVALLAAAAATALLIAPVAYHRVLFRHGRKPYLVRSAHRMAFGGLALLIVAVVSAVMLALDHVISRTLAVTVAGLTGVWFVVLWGVAPWIALRHGDRTTDADPRGGRPP